jgi:hypothetical protein
MCGPLLATIPEPYGQPSDAAALNVEGNGRPAGQIVVGNVVDYCGTDPQRRCEDGITGGSIAVCYVQTLSCPYHLTDDALGGYLLGSTYGGGLKGCWASGQHHLRHGKAVLIYWPMCGRFGAPGMMVKGFEQRHGGGLQIDGQGNLISLDYLAGKMYVWRDCLTRCKLMPGSPIKLQGASEFGKLAKDGTYVAADWQYGQIDDYTYTDNGSSVSLTYNFSFNNGLSGEVLGVAYNPALKGKVKN